LTSAPHAIVVDRPVDEVDEECRDGTDLPLRLDDRIEVELITDSLTRWTLTWGAVTHRVVVQGSAPLRGAVSCCWA
jgi:hypothetical protein